VEDHERLSAAEGRIPLEERVRDGLKIVELPGIEPGSPNPEIGLLRA
jgi:hypothetical protein